MKAWIFKKTVLSTAIAAAMCAGMAQAATQPWSSTHTFSWFDLVGSHDGETFAYVAGNTTGTGNGGDPTILCGIPWAPNVPACDPESNQPIDGNEAFKLYPIDSTFGFEVVPFAKATDKVRDGLHNEGWVGAIFEPGTNNIIGLELSDAETDKFLVPPGQGTWCTGLGGTSVKCSTEHFTVMEHVLTCHETVPYLNADPLTGDQLQIFDPDDPATLAVDCADTKLDNNLIVQNAEFEAGVPDTTPIDGLPVGADKYDPDTGTLIPVIDWVSNAGTFDPDKVLSLLDPNESTVLDDIMSGASYSITAKDDGKPLYRWGNLIKRPNDIRLFARFPLPKAWFQGAAYSQNDGNGYRITKARLIINHKITNNPNDQVRPEDMENEAAIGRQPGYDVVGTYGTGSWVSDTSCYQGNGIEIPAGTVLKNPAFAVPDTNVATHVWENDPYAWSEDLRLGLTNAWYTTVDREPFEWSYDTDGDGAADESYRAPLAEPLPVGTTLLTGPRWRLTPPKFGQDIPGLEIPNVNCAPPPYQKDLIKYTVGDLASELDPTGVGPVHLDLLDWEGDDERSVTDPDTGLPVSPLTFSNGWVSSGWYNDGTVVNPDVTVVNPKIKNVSVNGAPITQGFDLSIYVKGDRKPTALYDARLELEWDDGTPE
jgi:hypothetical protein